jgi:hypothetical protein
LPGAGRFTSCLSHGFSARSGIEQMSESLPTSLPTNVTPPLQDLPLTVAAQAKAARRRKALRLFDCGTCRHRLSFGAARCSQCWQPTPMLNRRDFYLGTGGALLMGGTYLYRLFAL